MRMKNTDVELGFKTALNGFKKDEVSDYISNMKFDFQRIIDEKEDELLIFKNLNAKLSDANDSALVEKENQIKYLNVKISGMNTQLESLEKEYKSELEKFEIIKMNLEKELNEKSGLNRFEIDQMKNEMITEIEMLQKEITQNRTELNQMDEQYRMLQFEKAEIEQEKIKMEMELEELKYLLENSKNNGATIVQSASTDSYNPEHFEKLEAIQKELNTVHLELEHARKEVEFATAKREQTEYELESIKCSLESLNKDYEQNIKENEHYKNNYEKLELECQHLVADNQNLEIENKDLTLKCSNLITENQRLLVENQSLLTSKEVIVRENQNIAIDYEQLKEKFGEIDSQKDALINVMIAAQKQADELLVQAKANASQIISTAKKEQIVIEERAKALIEEAKIRAAEEILRSEITVKIEQEKLAAIRREVKEVRDGIVSKLNNYKEGLDQLMVFESEKDKTVIPMRENHG